MFVYLLEPMNCIDKHFSFAIYLAHNQVLFNFYQEAKSANLDKFELPAKIKLLPDPWTPESGLVTAALKLKREAVKAKFKDELEKLYQ